MPNTGFTIEEAGVVYRVQGKPENELRFRKPIQEQTEESQTDSLESLEEAPTPPLQAPTSLDQEAIESTGPPVLEISDEPLPVQMPAKLSRLERNIVKAAVEVISQHQQPVPYRELLNQVYMDLVDRKVGFDSARQIETTLLDHNGREVLLIEEEDEANARMVKKWWLGEQKLAPEKRRRIPLVGRISTSKPQLHSFRFHIRRQESNYVEKAENDEN